MEYDSAYIELELAAQPGEDRQIGTSLIAAVEPDYQDVSTKAREVLGRSHDLRAAVYLAQAQLHLQGLAGFADATGYVRGCLEEFWDTCHPQLDSDDGDPTMRVNAVLTLADADGILRALRLTPLTQSRTFGRFSLRDIAIAAGEAKAPENAGAVPDSAAIAAAFQDTDPAELARLREAAERAAENVAAIGRTFDERIPGRGPDLGPLQKLLRQARDRLAEAIGDDIAELDPLEDIVTSGDASSQGRPAQQRSAGGIGGRRDVIGALDQIIEYYARNEPSSPVPILLSRAKRLVDADFLSIVRELAPAGFDNVRLIGGLADESD